MRTQENTTVMHRGDNMDKFIMTQDANVAAQFIKAGYKPLVDSGGFYIFENNAELTKICFGCLKDSAYIFTNKMFI